MNGPRPGALAYVCKMFPRISETFVLDEIAALRRAGVPFRIYSLLPAVPDERMHPEAETFAAETKILPQPTWAELPEFLSRVRRCVGAAPGRTFAQIMRSLLWPTPRSFRLLFRAITLADYLRRHEIAHMHAAWAHTPASVVEIASRLTGIPWSMAAHAKDIHTSDARSLVRKMTSACFTHVCTRQNRDLLRAAAARHAPHRPIDVRLVYHGVDTDYFSPAPGTGTSRESGAPLPGTRSCESTGEPQRPVVLAVARLVPKKGLDLLIEAAALLRARGIPFGIEIAGEGPVRPALERKIRELGLEGTVSLRGLLVREEVRAAMRRAACFALPCRIARDGDRDGIPNSLAEAMACGLPVVSTRLPSIEELVTHGETGLLVPPDDAVALADALARVLVDADARRAIGEKARASVVRTMSADACVAARARCLARALEIRSVLYLSADRGVPVRGGKGASIHVRSMIEAWRASGVGAALVTTNAGPEGGAEPGCEVREARTGERLERIARSVSRLLRGQAPLERALLRLADNRALARAARATARALRPAMVYERFSLGTIAGSLVARRLRIPHVVEVNAPLSDEEERYRGLGLARLTRWIERRVLRRADLVIVVSPALREHVERLGVPRERIRVVPNGVDQRLFHPARDGARVRHQLGLDGDFIAGFSGTLRPWHGVEHLIRGIAAASDATSAAASPGRPLRLLIVGEGPERAALETLARELGVSDRVTFLGAVPHAAVGDYLAACDVLCAPYGPLEDFYFSPIKIAEYRACGRPVLVSAVGHLKAQLGESSGAVLTEPGDEASIARALTALSGDPERCAALGRAAASSVWTWSDAARTVLRETEAVRPRLWAWPSTRPLTVGYVLKMFPRFSETFVLNEVLELERLGVRVVVFSMKAPSESVRQPGVDRVSAPVVVLSEIASGGDLVRSHLSCLARSPIRYARTAAFARSRRTESARTKFLHAALLAREARRRGVRHLHAHFASGPARQAKLASMLSGIPYSFTAHAKDLFWSGHDHRGGHKLKHRIRRARFVVAISEHNRAFMESLGFHVPRERIATIHNGLDLAAWRFRRPDGRPVRGDGDSAPLILAVGRLVEKKGFHVLLDAVAILRQRGVRCRCSIAGEGPERERLNEMIRDRNLNETVALLGAIRQNTLTADLYPRAHVLAQPCVIADDGDRDGIPTVILEAMATGLPVVATPVSGITEAVTHEESGLLVEPREPRALADALERVLTDDALSARFAARARAIVEERFDLRRNAGRFVSLLRASAYGYRPSRAIPSTLEPAR